MLPSGYSSNHRTARFEFWTFESSEVGACSFDSNKKSTIHAHRSAPYSLSIIADRDASINSELIEVQCKGKLVVNGSNRGQPERDEVE